MLIIYAHANKDAQQQNGMADKKSVLLGFGDVSKVMMLKEECTAAGTAKVVPSATEDLRPKVGECVSDR